MHSSLGNKSETPSQKKKEKLDLQILLEKSKDLVMLGSPACPSPPELTSLHSLMVLCNISEKIRPPQRLQEEVRGGGQPRECSLQKDCAVWLWLLLPIGFCFVPQITGCIKMELSSSWAVSPFSLKRFSGLPMDYLTPSALQTTSAC